MASEFFLIGEIVSWAGVPAVVTHVRDIRVAVRTLEGQDCLSSAATLAGWQPVPDRGRVLSLLGAP